jgi:uncharacterized protein involved in exopolysaccharide biosynthesis
MSRSLKISGPSRTDQNVIRDYQKDIRYDQTTIRQNQADMRSDYAAEKATGVNDQAQIAQVKANIHTYPQQEQDDREAIRKDAPA